MSFLKDFREELSQAVNELVNMEDGDNATLGGKNEKEEEDKMARKKKNGVSVNEDNTEPVKDIDIKEDTEVNTLGNIDGSVGKMDDNVDMEVLNELFGNESKEAAVEDNLAEEPDIALDNIDISDYLEEEQHKEERAEEERREGTYGMSEEESVIKELARDIQSKMNDDKLEEMMTDDKESKKAALRGMRPEENITYEENEESALATEEVAEVTKGTMIDGNIVSEGSMNIYGKIKGNVACRGKLVVCGTIVGSSRGAEIFTNNARIEGDVTSDGSIKIGNGTVIIGNIYGASAVIAGAVQGDVDIQGPVIIDGTAVIQGNIRSRSVQVNNGAAIEGMISQCYADIDYAALFDKTFSQS